MSDFNDLFFDKDDASAQIVSGKGGFYIDSIHDLSPVGYEVGGKAQNASIPYSVVRGREFDAQGNFSGSTDRRYPGITSSQLRQLITTQLITPHQTEQDWARSGRSGQYPKNPYDITNLGALTDGTSSPSLGFDEIQGDKEGSRFYDADKSSRRMTSDELEDYKRLLESGQPKGFYDEWDAPEEKPPGDDDEGMNWWQMLGAGAGAVGTAIGAREMVRKSKYGQAANTSKVYGQYTQGAEGKDYGSGMGEPHFTRKDELANPSKANPYTETTDPRTGKVSYVPIQNPQAQGQEGFLMRRGRNLLDLGSTITGLQYHARPTGDPLPGPTPEGTAPPEVANPELAAPAANPELAAPAPEAAPAPAPAEAAPAPAPAEVAPAPAPAEVAPTPAEVAAAAAATGPAPAEVSNPYLEQAQQTANHYAQDKSNALLTEMETALQNPDLSPEDLEALKAQSQQAYKTELEGLKSNIIEQQEVTQGSARGNTFPSGQRVGDVTSSLSDIYTGPKDALDPMSRTDNTPPGENASLADPAVANPELTEPAPTTESIPPGPVEQSLESAGAELRPHVVETADTAALATRQGEPGGPTEQLRMNTTTDGSLINGVSDVGTTQNPNQNMSAGDLAEGLSHLSEIVQDGEVAAGTVDELHLKQQVKPIIDLFGAVGAAPKGINLGFSPNALLEINTMPDNVNLDMVLGLLHKDLDFEFKKNADFSDMHLSTSRAEALQKSLKGIYEFEHHVPEMRDIARKLSQTAFDHPVGEFSPAVMTDQMIGTIRALPAPMPRVAPTPRPKLPGK